MDSIIEDIVKDIEPLDSEIMKVVKQRQDDLTKPKESLGVLEDLSIKIAGITRNTIPQIKHKVIITMVSDHGVVEEHVSAYPKDVTYQMVYNFANGGAGINVLARHIGARVVVVDMGISKDINHPLVVNKKIGYGTKNMAKCPAMTREDAIKSIIAGCEIVNNELKKGMDIVGIGDMGIGNTTPSSAIVSVFTGEDVEKVTGRGTGIDDITYRNKINVIKKAIKINNPDPNDPIDVLAKVGGFEIGGLAGVILACAKNRIPVVINGFISGASALVAAKICLKCKDYMIAAHQSVEIGHKVILDYLGLNPLLNLNLRLGEGTGAALGIFLVEAGVKILNEMATFTSAGVSRKLNGYNTMRKWAND